MLCRLSSGRCLNTTHIEDGAASIRVGPFAVDQSYWQFYLGFEGANLSLSYTGGNGTLHVLAEPLGCAQEGQRPGEAPHTLGAVPDGSLPRAAETVGSRSAAAGTVALSHSFAPDGSRPTPDVALGGVGPRAASDGGRENHRSPGVNCSDFVLVVVPRYLWFRGGDLAVDAASGAVTLSPLGHAAPTVISPTRLPTTGLALPTALTTAPHAAFSLGGGRPLGLREGSRAPSLGTVRAAVHAARAAELARYAAYGVHAEVKEALQAATLWYVNISRNRHRALCLIYPGITNVESQIYLDLVDAPAYTGTTSTRPPSTARSCPSRARGTSSSTTSTWTGPT